jgi:hypothetical protein
VNVLCFYQLGPYSFTHRGSPRGCEVFNEAELLYPKAVIQALTPPKTFLNHTHIEISNMVRLAFDKLKAKTCKVVGKSSSMIAHWLHKTIGKVQKPAKCKGLSENCGGIKKSIPKGTKPPKRLRAKSKSRKRKQGHFGRNEALKRLRAKSKSRKRKQGRSERNKTPKRPGAKSKSRKHKQERSRRNKAPKRLRAKSKLRKHK